MTRAPDWSQNEFEILVNGYGLSDEELKQRLPRRKPDAIAIVQEGIHRFHTGKDKKDKWRMLSEKMRQYLKERRDPVICPKCGEKF